MRIILDKEVDKMLRRNTNQEQIVFESLEYLGHATSDCLISYIKDKYTNIALATIYRNLTKLLNEKKIKKVKLGQIDVYETVKEKHYHFHCKNCGSIIDIKPKSIPYSLETINKIEEEYVDDCDLVLYGICHNCK